MSNQVDEPYMVHEPRQIVGELMLGKWALYAHEWLPEDTDLRTWKTTLERLCAAAGLEVEIITDHRKDMTIAWNRALPPTPEQIYTSVQAVRKWSSRKPEKTVTLDTARTADTACPTESPRQERQAG